MGRRPDLRSSEFERRSRFQQLTKLPDGHNTVAVIAAISRWIESHDRVIVSLTWDRGAELTNWKHLRQLGIDIYFCDPKSPWQRGTNENQNRQTRFWLPKGTGLSARSQDYLDRVCHILNTTTSSAPSKLSTMSPPLTSK